MGSPARCSEAWACGSPHFRKMLRHEISLYNFITVCTTSNTEHTIFLALSSDLPTVGKLHFTNTTQCFCLKWMMQSPRHGRVMSYFLFFGEGRNWSGWACMLGGPGLKKDWNLHAGPIFLARAYLYIRLKKTLSSIHLVTCTQHDILTVWPITLQDWSTKSHSHSSHIARQNNDKIL